MIVIILFVIFCYYFFQNRVDEIDSFIYVKQYTKQCIFQIISNRGKINTVDKISLENDINKTAKKIAKSMSRFPRGKQILDKLKNEQNDFTFFILPDTLLQKSKVQYYQFLLNKSYQIANEKNHLDNIQSKLYLEKIYSSSNGKDLSS